MAKGSHTSIIPMKVTAGIRGSQVQGIPGFFVVVSADGTVAISRNWGRRCQHIHAKKIIMASIIRYCGILMKTGNIKRPSLLRWESHCRYYRVHRTRYVVELYTSRPVLHPLLLRDVVRWLLYYTVVCELISRLLHDQVEVRRVASVGLRHGCWSESASMPQAQRD